MVEVLLFVTYWTGLVIYLVVVGGLAVLSIKHEASKPDPDKLHLYAFIPLMFVTGLIFTPVWPILLAIFLLWLFLATIIYFLKKVFTKHEKTKPRPTSNPKLYDDYGHRLPLR